MTDKYSEAIQKAIENGDTMDDKMEAFEKIHEIIKFKSFGKVKIGRKDKAKKNKNERKSDAKKHL